MLVMAFGDTLGYTGIDQAALSVAKPGISISIIPRKGFTAPHMQMVML
jgi:hypothetical protein